MKINLEMIEMLYELLSYDEFNEELCNKFLKLKQIEDLILHDKELKRDTSVESLRNNLINTFNKCDNDCYSFNHIMTDLTLLDSALKYIKDNENKIYENISKRISRYVLSECLNDCTYYIYGGGWDYGFCQGESEVYINIAKLQNNLTNIEDILSHEFYHARKRNIDMEKTFSMNFAKENYLDILFIYFLEEGIAKLIELEYEQKTYESGVLKKEHFDKKYEYMNLLNNCIKEISLKNNYDEKFISDFLGEFSSLYVVGYWIGQVLYKHGGRDYLNIWTLDHNHKKCIKVFIESLRKDNILSGLSMEVENYILNYCLE